MPVFRLTDELVFPPPHLAEDGLIAVGGDLRRERLLLAYRQGIFPWYSEGEPLLWWSPDPRMILLPGEFHLSKRFLRNLRKTPFKVTLDRAFAEVIRGCAAVPRHGQDGTWITREMITAYVGLHEEGYAHSAECWLNGRLVGGLYGISLGGCFFGESMYSLEADASKTALAALTRQLQACDIDLIDCQVSNPHLRRLGARPVRRTAFLKMLRAALEKPTHQGRWQLQIPFP